MKMKRNNKTDARPGEKGARSFHRSFGMVALSVFAAVIVALFGAAPAFAATTTSGPAIDKTVKELKDSAGNVYGGTINLSVKGSSSYSSTTTSANVIFVVDVSGSMNDEYSLAKDNNGTYSKDDKDLAYRYGSRLTGYHYVTISEYNQHPDHHYYNLDKSAIYELTRYTDGRIAEANVYTGERYSHVAQSQTRLAAAKSAINAAASSILGQDNTKVSLVTFSDFANVDLYPSDDLSSFNSSVDGLTATGGTNWEAGLTKASDLVSTDSNNYVIFVSDGNPTFRNSANGYYRDQNQNGTYGTGNSDPGERDFNAADAVAKSLIKSGVTLYNINAFGDADNMQNLGDISADHYFNASDSTSLQNALSKIVQDIVNAHSYRKVAMTDTLSDAVEAITADGKLDSNSVTVSVKDEKGDDVKLTKNSNGSYSYTKDGKPGSFSGPTASGKTVTWNLGDKYQLEDGWTYIASFNVKLKQETLDKAADLVNSGKTSDGDLTYGNGVVNAYTNTDSDNNKVSYVKQTTVNNKITEEPDDQKFPRPQISVATASNLTVSKSVSGGAANKYQDFTFEITAPSAINDTYKVKVSGGSNDETVTFEKGVATMQLHHGQSKTIVGLPVGTTLTVKETGLSGNAKTSTTASVNGAKAEYVKDETSSDTDTRPVSVLLQAKAYTINGTTLSAPDTANTVAFTNYAELIPDTGISTNPLPMVVLLGVAVAGGVAVAAGVRKNHGREE